MYALVESKVRDVVECRLLSFAVGIDSGGDCRARCGGHGYREYDGRGGAEADMRWDASCRGVLVRPRPATHAILMLLKAGGTVCQIWCVPKHS